MNIAKNIDRKLLLLLYLFSNTVCFIVYYYTGVVEGDVRGLPVEHELALILSYCQVILGFILFYYWFSLAESISLNLKTFDKINRHQFFSMVILIINVIYSFLAIKYKFGFSGVEYNKSMPTILLYIFIVIQPLYLTCIYLAYFTNVRSNIYNVNALMIVALCLYQGWLTSLIFIAYLYFLKYKDIIFKNKIKFILISILLFLSTPILKASKVIFMIYHQNGLSNLSEAYDLFKIHYAQSDSFIGNMLFYLYKTIERFEHTATTYFLNINDYAEDFGVRYYGFILDNWISQRIHGVFNVNRNLIPAQNYIANQIEGNYTWKIQIALDSWLSLNMIFLPSLILFVSFLLLISNCLCRIISKERNLSSLNWLMAIVLLYHGWFFSYVLFVQALFVFLTLIVIREVLKKYVDH